MGRWMIPCLAMVACTLANGCAARKSSLTAADYQERAGTIRKIGIVMVGAGIRHLHKGGRSSPDTDSSGECASCVVETVEQSLAARGYASAALPHDRDFLMLLAAYRQVRDDLFNASPSDTRTLPGIAPLAGAPGLCAKNGVDALVVVGACEHHFPEGGRAVFWEQAFLRIYFGRGAAYADLAAVDCTGRIIHYSQQSGTYCPLSDQQGVHKVFDELVSGLPPVVRR